MDYSETKPGLKSALARFREIYGDGEVRALQAPARINILGEHVDYVSYIPTASLPFGSSEHRMVMLFRAAGDGRVRGASMLDKFPPFDFALDDEAVGDRHSGSWESAVFGRPVPAPHWSNYVRGAAQFARWKFGPDIERGFHFLIDSSIPPQSGASSSSALVALAGAAVRLANGIGYRPEELALDSSQAEWYLGTRGGALDHTAICLARRGCAVHISHKDRVVESIPLPVEGYRWITFFSHEADKGREVMLEYNERAAVSRFLIPALRERLQANELPESITLEEFEKLHPQAFLECKRAFPALASERMNRPLKVKDRQKHHFAETFLVRAAVEILRSPESIDSKMRDLGNLINMSHMSLRMWYEVSTPDVETLIDIIRSCSQVYGARLMGGGFGGNVLVLVAAPSVQALIDRVQKEYYEPRGRDCMREGAVMISTPGDGVAEFDPESF